MNRKKGRSASGETLVEVMVSAVIFLLMVALLSGAVSFCTNAQQKSALLRKRNAAVCAALRADAGAGSGSGDATLAFYAVSADGSQTGSLVFNLPVKLATKSIIDDEGETIEFRLLAPKPKGEGAAP